MSGAERVKCNKSENLLQIKRPNKQKCCSEYFKEYLSRFP